MRKILQSLTLILPVLLNMPSGNAQIIYVAQNGTGSGNSWAEATGNLKSALDNAVAGTQIWVKEGTYRPTSCSNCSFSQRNLRFEVKNGVKLFGGFAGNETAPGERNITAHPTYLSGDIDQDGTLANNSFTVVYTGNVSNLTVVDGFIITGGNANDNTAALGAPQNSGGGWFNAGSSSSGGSHPQIFNCIFTNNYAWGHGGGMVNDGSFSGDCHPSLTDCVFSGNVARSGGGALFNTGAFNGQCNPVLLRCSFENNECQLSDGGAVFSIGSDGGVCNPVFTECHFTSNTAFNDGGAMFNFGKGGNSSPVVVNSSFTENEAIAGGAVYNDGTFNGFSGSSFTGCSFTGNHSYGGDGGAIYNSAYHGVCNPEMMNCEFDVNHSAFAGAAMFNNGVEGICNPSILNCRFTNNLADTYAGAIYNQGKTGNSSPNISNCIFFNNSALSAGAIYNLGAEGGNANAFITNCTFYGNHANVGGAVYCNAGEQGTGVASPTVRNCIFWGNTAGEGKVFRIIWGTPTISYSLADVADCQALYNGMGGSVNCGPGLIFNQNPLFNNPATGNFHLQNGSPAIDQGSNDAITQMGITVDLDGKPRVFNATVDLGVFEFGSTAGSAPVILQNPENQEVCINESVTFSVSASGSPPLSFQWLKNGVAIPGATGSTFTISSATLSDVASYACAVFNSTGMSATSELAVLTVMEPVHVSLMIQASQTEICAGEEITLSAIPVNGGAAPVFQWFINGNAFGSSISTFSISQLNDGDTFSCQLTSSENCVLNNVALSNPVVIHVDPMLVASVQIEDLNGVTCEGEPVVFQAISVNGGSLPTFQWLLNGNLVGENTPDYFLAAAEQGDRVQCVMISSKNCLVANPVESNVIELQITPTVTPSITITPSSDSIVCIGTPVSFSAVTEGAGNAPDFTWRVNGIPAGFNQPVFTTSDLKDQDEITCQLTSSLLCVTENPVWSNAVVVSVDSCSVSANEQKAGLETCSVYPNPSSGKIFVEILESSGNFALHLLNLKGQITYTAFEEHPVFPYKRTLDLTDFPKGIYYLQIITGQSLTVKKVTLQ